MKERLILEVGNKKYEAVLTKKNKLCKGCCFLDDEHCPEILTVIDCGFAIWKEIIKIDYNKQV